MKKILILASTICLSLINLGNKNENLDYRIYHKRVVKAENLIASENYRAALVEYEFLFQNYDFVFLRDYQIASQLALTLRDKPKCKSLLIKGIKGGWELKSIQKNKFLSPICGGQDWKTIKNQYPSLREDYELGLNQILLKKVKQMFANDQRKAFAALFKISSKAQVRYAEKKFAPHSEKQIMEIAALIDEFGYPGEKLIGNNYWVSTIISHHNSISTAYNKVDSLYKKIKPILTKQLKIGNVSPFELAQIDEWFLATTQENKMANYGILEGPLLVNKKATNNLREKHFIRSIETHNKLIEIQNKTGMDFYLEGHPWSSEKITIRD